MRVRTTGRISSISPTDRSPTARVRSRKLRAEPRHQPIEQYDPAKAKQLLQEAQCLPCKVTLAISTSGSGQMQSLPMNELVKSQMDAAGFDVKLEPKDRRILYGRPPRLDRARAAPRPRH